MQNAYLFPSDTPSPGRLPNSRNSLVGSLASRRSRARPRAPIGLPLVALVVEKLRHLPAQPLVARIVVKFPMPMLPQSEPCAAERRPDDDQPPRTARAV